MKKVLVKLGVGFGLMLILVGCPTIIPLVDTEQPRILLGITGPGVSQNMTNPPRLIWNDPSRGGLFELLPDREYNFRLIASDEGGVAYVHLRMPLHTTVTDLLPADTINTIITHERVVIASGSRDDPRRSLIITGRFRTPATSSSGPTTTFPFLVRAEDFGGRSGSPNERSMSVIASIDFSLP